MLQANEIKQRFDQIQQTIGEAEQACKSSQDTPPEMRDCIDRLARESGKVKQVMQSNDEAQMVQAIDQLEDLSDEAKRVSRSDPHMPANLESAVSKVHAELSKLKHQLH